MIFGTPVFAILMLCLGIWAFRMARDPRRWRLWWLALAGAPYGASRTLRRRQELQLLVTAYFTGLLSLAVAGSAIYWTVDEVQAMRQPKTRLELEHEHAQREVEELRSWRIFDTLKRALELRAGR